jgi:phage shock protein PspC (stress-responsive transcriptional regulator)
MNKTININLGGIFFHIDEVAYQKLKRYLDAIRKSLSDDPQGQDEIINDIEHRIGELLSERITNDRQVINENDIDEITKIMGKPEDYLVDEELFEDEPNTKRSSNTNTKKLFRDGDDKFLGGVCSGLAYYVGIEVIWMRIIWLILLFGFGIGFLIYPLLWILIPQAETTAEKLQMKGEPVNIDNIERKIREELSGVTSKVKKGVNEVTDTVKSSEFQNKAKSGLQELIDTLGKIILAILNVFGKFIGAILILIAALTLLGLIFGAFSWGSIEIMGFGNTYNHIPPFIHNGILPPWLLIIFSFIAVGIPFVVLFMLGLRILSNNVKSFSTTTKLSLLGVWIIALLGLGFAAINFATQTASKGIFNTTEELQTATLDTLKIKMLSDENLSNNRELRKRYNPELVYDNEIQKLYSSRINLDIKPTENATGYLKIRKNSEGNNRLNANNTAEKIEYKYNLGANHLLLNGYFLSDVENQFKKQVVDITVYLPINSVVYLDKSTRTFLDDVDNIQNIYDGDMPKHYYKVEEEGLKCLDCDPSIFGEPYKNKNNHFKLNLDENGLKIKVKDGNKKADIKIDEHGININ